MKKILSVCLIFLGALGCASTQELAPPDFSQMEQRFLSLEQVRTGMTLADIETVVGKQIIVGYELVDAQTGQYKPLVRDNPYRRESIGKYDVAYFLVGIKKADDRISDDELVPLVFQNGRLVGMGWPFFDAKVKRR